MMDANGYVKLADFGVVSRLSKNSSQSVGFSTLFMSPEIVENVLLNKNHIL